MKSRYVSVSFVCNDSMSIHKSRNVGRWCAVVTMSLVENGIRWKDGEMRWRDGKMEVSAILGDHRLRKCPRADDHEADIDTHKPPRSRMQPASGSLDAGFRVEFVL